MQNPQTTGPAISRDMRVLLGEDLNCLGRDCHAMSRSAWSAAVYRRFQEHARPTGISPTPQCKPLSHSMRFRTSKSGPKSRESGQNQTTTDRKILSRVVAQGGQRVLPARITNPYSARFFRSRRFKLIQGNSSQFKRFYLLHFLFLCAPSKTFIA